MSFGTNEMSTPTNESVSPSLQLSDSRGTRYPNAFFDLAQQYMPPTIKELFRWCTFYFYNSPLIGATMKKISLYPITDLIYEDDKESTRTLWETVLTEELKIKSRLAEINLDRHVYGNAFVSVHLPFTRFLTCKQCGDRQPISQWDWSFNGSDYHFTGKCSKCNTHGPVDVRDVPYKDRKGIRIIRWNPENMHIKFNEYTGRYIYMYTVPPKLRNMILRGDKDILEDTPLIVLEALKKRRMIRLNPDSIFHIKAPTLAEQDQGWGKPAIIHVLKDMYYLYTLRRSQEAIAMEHIIPCDIIYPLPNAQQDPYLHTDLSNWRIQIETIIRKHRRDPNFKGVVPVPVGTVRIGGDGKMLLLSPELNYLNQTIVGGLGMSAEMLFGQGQSYSGSSITLRMLENDFIQNRSDLIDFTMWLKNKIRIWLGYPDIKNVRFSDFRMADDVQRTQQLIGLNAQGKVSDDTMLTELGYDWEQEAQKMLQEAQFRNYLMDVQTKGSAKSQGEAQMIQANYQKKIQENMGPVGPDGQPMPPQVDQNGQPMPPQMDQNGQPMPPDQAGGVPTGAPGEQQAAGAEPQGSPGETLLQGKVQAWANKLMQTDPATATDVLNKLKTAMPEIGMAVEQQMSMLRAGVGDPSQAQGMQTSAVTTNKQKFQGQANPGSV